MRDDCVLGGVCGGCPWILFPIEEQIRKKTEALHLELSQAGVPWDKDIQLHSCGTFGVRDRVDLTIEGNQIGLMDLRNGALIDITACPMMSPTLEAWFREFRADLPIGIKKGSVRLRVGPSGKRGVWLDFANLDVKMLFDEKKWLQGLLQKSFVEIGQRRKVLAESENKLVLKDPQPAAWFETYLNKPVELFCHVGSFTQPGFKANETLVEIVKRNLLAAGCRKWLELGSGIGNFTLPLAQMSESVIAVELDTLSASCLRLNSKNHGLGNIEILNSDYRNFSGGGKVDAVLCDPPRSGLGSFVEWLGLQNSVTTIIYVTCFAKSFAQDARELGRYGFMIENLEAVDQFPQSSHCEYVARFRKTSIDSIA
jgi:23S rRNA (uracil1939-C5)-methyltransferase